MLLCSISVATAVLAHRHIRSFAVATVVAGLGANGLFLLLATIHEGHVDKFLPIACCTGSALSTGIALVVGIGYHRSRPPPIQPGHCQRCGYDLTGNVSGVCPECGAKI